MQVAAGRRTLAEKKAAAAATETMTLPSTPQHTTTCDPNRTFQDTGPGAPSGVILGRSTAQTRGVAAAESSAQPS
jgi:hypothetical protein